MELQQGLSLVIQQFMALGKKNMRLTGRKKRALLLQFLIPLLFLSLVYGVDQALKDLQKTDPQYSEVRDPEVTTLPQAIPPCEDFTVQLPCFDFVWSGPSNNPRIQRIVDAIMANNPGRSIPSTKVKSFKTPEETDAWFNENIARCPGALHLGEESPKVVSYGIQVNSSVTTLEPSEDSSYYFEIPIQMAAEREISKILLGDDPNFTWNVGLKDFAHPQRPLGLQNTFSIFGALCFPLMTFFIFQNQLSSVVHEKELKLRQAMNIMGLYDSAYWLSWLAWEMVMTFIVALSISIFGLVLRFSFFTRNNFLIVLILLYLYLLAMTSIAFALSALIQSSSSAYLLTIAVLIINMLVKTVVLVEAQKKKMYNNIQKILPAGPFSCAIDMLLGATSSPNDPGINWKDRNQKRPSCMLYTVDGAFRQLILHFFLWLIVALYLDNVVTSVNRTPKPLLYFLNPGYWTGRGGTRTSGGGGAIFSSFGGKPKPEEITPDDEDVLEEENKIRKQLANGSMDPEVAVEIRGLIKTYVGKGSCCMKTPPFHAIKGLWVNFPKDQLFCLLGHNGAGKSTTISCLTGITSVSGGDALIYENSIRSSVGMTNIRRMIGVCPQFDILWNVLTGEEHLELFSNIKGLPPDSILTITQKLLEDVKLDKSAKVRAGSYSGGMRRRLSVAAALLGDPKLVILDEPTTGMDPITRRHVWDIIESAKRGRAIVLTTHSMEEADVLSDRIGIMSKGRLRCVGTPIRLKMRFGTGFVANMSFSNNADEASNAKGREALKSFFLNQLNVTPQEETLGFITFVIPHDREPLLKNTFGEVQVRQTEFGISDIQLGLATLEEVFLNVTRQDEMGIAASQGNSDAHV